MFNFGDLPSIDADPSQVLSNGQILNRLQEINGNPQIDGDHDEPESGGKAGGANNKKMAGRNIDYWYWIYWSAMKRR